MKPDPLDAEPRTPTLANAVLLVDDEPQACKWFARLYGDEFTVLTASGVDEALALLAERGREVAVLLSDYRMPGRDGVALLTEVRQHHSHVARLLVSAYADKDVAMAAVNQGHVQQILEKPLDPDRTRLVLRAALASSLRAGRERELVERRAAAMRETLGFLAHEVTTPLATVRGVLSAMRDRHEAAPADDGAVAHLVQRRPGELLHMIESAQRRTDYAQSLVSSFVQTARDAYQPGALVALRASELVLAVRDEYPFDDDEARWLACDIAADFPLPGRRDLLYLVLCTLVKNALLALRSQLPVQPPRLGITLTRSAPAPGLPEQPTLEVSDNGPGIAPEVLPRLTREPFTTRAASGGNGMGLLFCQRVMTSLGGAITLSSLAGQGATVRLLFPAADTLTQKERP